MDPAILSATSALAGSLIGGASSLVASWITQREQLRSQMFLQQAVKREALYTEFIVEA
jgi:citrate synthase